VLSCPFYGVTPGSKNALGEALTLARGIENSAWRDSALLKIAPLLPPEQGMAVARTIENAQHRAEALAKIASLLRPEEGLVARGIDDLRWRDKALAEIVPRLALQAHLSIVEEILSSVRRIDENLRAEVLSAVASLPSDGQFAHAFRRQWSETVRMLAMRTRQNCVADFGKILPMMEAIGGEAAIRSLARSINTVGSWWP
jgi:hypothetical protein